MPIETKQYISKGTDIIIKVASIIGAIAVIAGGYTFYLNYVWKPKITVASVDYEKGEAVLKSGSKLIKVFGNSEFYVNGDWSLRLGSTSNGDFEIYDRIELLRNGMVVEYIKKQNEA